MAIELTGNAEIDQQHAILDSIVGKATNFCTELRRTNAACSECSAHNRQHCASALNSSARELRAFLVGHNTYEEKMMDLLPNTPQCQAHIVEHKRAHSWIARQLKALSVQIENHDPRVAGALMVRIAKSWLGVHAARLDQPLVRHLDDANIAEIEFDRELVIMLDRHVFHNRPVTARSSPHSSLALMKKKMEVRGRFESLSPTQRTVFWLVVSGKKNREIAIEHGISVNTVKSHRAAIFQKMEVKSVLELVIKADVLR